MKKHHSGKTALAIILFSVVIAICISLLSIFAWQYFSNAKTATDMQEKYTAERKEESIPAKPGAAVPNAPVINTVSVPEESKAPVRLLAVDHAGLLSENQDYIGWLDIPGTKISYPVYFSGDNEKYLRHAPDLSYQYGGSLFADMDTDENARNIIIYGHNMRSGTMFGRLKDYTGKDFYDEHPYIVLYPADCDGYELYRICSVYTCDGSSVINKTGQIHFADDKAVASYAKKTASYSLHKDFDAAESYERMLTLSTCYGQSYSNTRLIVNAVLIEKGGDTTSYFNY